MLWTKDELEAVLVYNEVDKTWEAYTNIPRYQTKFKKKNWRLKKVEYAHGKEISWTFIAPQNAISIRDTTKKRTVTEEQKKDASERLREARKKKNEL